MKPVSGSVLRGKKEPLIFPLRKDAPVGGKSRVVDRKHILGNGLQPEHSVGVLSVGCRSVSAAAPETDGRSRLKKNGLPTGSQHGLG